MFFAASCLNQRTGFFGAIFLFEHSTVSLGFLFFSLLNKQICWTSSNSISGSSGYYCSKGTQYSVTVMMKVLSHCNDFRWNEKSPNYVQQSLQMQNPRLLQTRLKRSPNYVQQSLQVQNPRLLQTRLKRCSDTDPLQSVIRWRFARDRRIFSPSQTTGHEFSRVWFSFSSSLSRHIHSL